MLLFIVLLPKLDIRGYRILVACLLIMAYGLAGLLITGRVELAYIIAGIRTYIFILVVSLFYMVHEKYLTSDDGLNMVNLYIKFCIFLEFAIVMIQVVTSDSLSRFGNGGYRFIGGFAGSGNLGCFSIATVTYLTIMHLCYKKISNLEFIVFMFMNVFIVAASGTRTAIVIVVVYVLYVMIKMLGAHLNRSLIYGLFGFFIVSIGPFFLNYLVSRTGRGEFIDSGSGRSIIFSNLFSNGTTFEVIFGRGFGFGTNASVALNATGTQVSDATFNLVMGQFGLIGLMVFLVTLLYLFNKIIKVSREYFPISILHYIYDNNIVFSREFV